MHRARVGKERMPNRILHDKEVSRTMELHKKKMASIKGRKFGTGTVDSTKPLTTTLRHLNANAKRKKIREERFQEIERENKLLLQRMTRILTNEDEPYADYRWRPKSLNSVSRKQMMRKINSENEAILKRIEKSRPFYDHGVWEEESVERKALVSRIRKVRYDASTSSQLLPATIQDIEALDVSSQRSVQKVREALTSAGMGQPLDPDLDLEKVLGRPKTTVPRRLKPVGSKDRMSTSMSERNLARKSPTKKTRKRRPKTVGDQPNARASVSQGRKKDKKRVSIFTPDEQPSAADKASENGDEEVEQLNVENLEESLPIIASKSISGPLPQVLLDKPNVPCRLKKVGVPFVRKVRANISISKSHNNQNIEIKCWSKGISVPQIDVTRSLPVDEVLEYCPDFYCNNDPMDQDDLIELAELLLERIEFKDQKGRIKIIFSSADSSSLQSFQEEDTENSLDPNESDLLYKGGRKVRFLNIEDGLPVSKLLLLVQVGDHAEKQGYIEVCAMPISKLVDFTELKMVARLPTLAVVDRDAAIEYAHHLVNHLAVEKRDGSYILSLGKLKGQPMF
mmetsp:Transcript_33246/g.43823  ORF Transcript_33246/g.43823 Transcript_33246/m.43823 type:complete len:568 (+) Transcript_33246:153-1856(+)